MRFKGTSIDAVLDQTATELSLLEEFFNSLKALKHRIIKIHYFITSKAISGAVLPIIVVCGRVQ